MAWPGTARPRARAMLSGRVRRLPERQVPAAVTFGYLREREHRSHTATVVPSVDLEREDPVATGAGLSSQNMELLASYSCPDYVARTASRRDPATGANWRGGEAGSSLQW
jgi:hypothetical protein